MKTIIVKATKENQPELVKFIKRLEKYTDKQIEDAVICTRYVSAENYNTIYGELKDAVSINDFDLFIIGVVDFDSCVTSLQGLNKAHTMVCDTTDISSAKNYIIMV